MFDVLILSRLSTQMLILLIHDVSTTRCVDEQWVKTFDGFAGTGDRQTTALSRPLCIVAGIHSNKGDTRRRAEPPRCRSSSHPLEVPSGRIDPRRLVSIDETWPGQDIHGPTTRLSSSPGVHPFKVHWRAMTPHCHSASQLTGATAYRP